MGKISRDILIADIVAMFFIFPVLSMIKLTLDRRQVFVATCTLSFGVVSSGMHILLNNESLFAVFVIVTRSLGAFLVFFFFFGAAKRTGIFFGISILAVICVGVIGTADQLASGEKSYYGFARVGTNVTPANAGFILGSLFIACLVFVLIKPSVRFRYFERVILYLAILFSTICLVLVVLTESKSSIIGSIAGGLFVVLALMALRKMNRLIAYTSTILILSVLLVVVYSLTSKTGLLYTSFNRFDRVDFSIADRFGKALFYFNHSSSEISDPVTFLLFGMGPGAAATFSYTPGVSFFSFDSVFGRMFWEWGPVGTACWLWFFGDVLVRTFHRSYRHGLGIVAMYIFAVVYGVGVEFLWIGPSGYVFMMFMGIVSGLATQDELLSEVSVNKHKYRKIDVPSFSGLNQLP